MYFGNGGRVHKPKNIDRKKQEEAFFLEFPEAANAVDTLTLVL